MPWLFCIAGTIFCAAGVYYFYKHLFDQEDSLGKDNHSIKWSFIIMGMGVILIGIGTAKYFHLL